jgi:GNAT superfamily N-acetyltransferase
VNPSQLASRLAALPGVRTVVAPGGPDWQRDGTELISVLPTAGPSDSAGSATIAAVPASWIFLASWLFRICARGCRPVPAGAVAAEGFVFLDSRIREHGGTGPVLTCEQDGQVVGAIGPMEIMPDSQDAARLLPQYFGVLPEYRGLGLGRSLWQAAMHWGQQHDAAYQLLQTEVDGASDRLCRSEGLTDLGLVSTTPL